MVVFGFVFAFPGQLFLSSVDIKIIVWNHYNNKNKSSLFRIKMFIAFDGIKVEVW